LIEGIFRRRVATRTLAFAAIAVALIGLRILERGEGFQPRTLLLLAMWRPGHSRPERRFSAPSPSRRRAGRRCCAAPLRPHSSPGALRLRGPDLLARSADDRIRLRP
jgi:hypothetical protein